MNGWDHDSIQVLEDECRLVVVQDELQVCPYLADATARMPLHLPLGSVTPAITDRLLALGYRRSGDFVYRTQCPGCTECKPTRVPVEQFYFRSSFRRVLNRGDRELRVVWSQPTVDRYRLQMFNLHREIRGLGSGEPADADQYRGFLADSCCDSRELAVFAGDQLIAVSVVDVGDESVSAVYTHFLPEFGRYSLGTYAVLKQILWAKQTNRKYVYLGMYVAANQHLNYKARFQPQQRLLDGSWRFCEE